MAYTASQLVGMGYGGYNGWGDAEANADFNATGGQGKKSNTSSSSSGGGMGDLGQTDTLASQQRDRMNQQFATDKADVNDFTTRYNNATQQAVTDTSNKYHLPDLVNISNALDSRISQLSGNTNNAGAEGMASASQVDNAINSHYLPQFNQATTNLNRSTQAAQTETQQRLAPYQTEATMLNDRLAREMTGFTSEQQNELTGLIAKIQAGVTLTNAEQERANQLAIAEEGYTNALKVAQTQAGATTQAAQIEANKPISVAPAGTVYSPTANGGKGGYVGGGGGTGGGVFSDNGGTSNTAPSFFTPDNKALSYTPGMAGLTTNT